MLRHPLRSAAVVVAAALFAGAAWLPLPYYAIGPGPASEVTPLIRFDERQRFEPSGKLVWATVRLEQVTPLLALRRWLDDDWEIVAEDVVYPPDVPRDIEERRSRSQMDQSKIDAAFVVLSMLTNYPRDHGGGALIEAIVTGCPAEGVLFPGDVVTTIDGRDIDTRREASRAIDAAPPRQEMVFTIEVDDETEDVTLARRRCVEETGPLVGVRMLETFPFEIAIASGDVGGPSAGLMWALGLYELMTPEDLTGGRIVSGTGTIDLDGNVGRIGGIRDKVIAARDAGASIFLAPAADARRLDEIDTGDMRIVAVETFEDALAALGADVSAA